MAHTSIITGHNVHIRQTPASVGDRLLAQLIDLAIIFGYTFTIIMLLTLVLDKYLIDLPEWAQTWIVFIMLLPPIFYLPACEMFNHGQTFGKAALKTRVVMADGSTPTIGACLLRWMLYPIDVFVTFGLGVVFILFTEKNQRMGDLAAGTIVIKINADENSAVSLTDFYYVQNGYLPTYHEASELNLRQIDVISRTLYSRDAANRDNYIGRLALKVQQTLHVLPQPAMTQEQFLQTIINDFHYYASTLDE